MKYFEAGYILHLQPLNFMMSSKSICRCLTWNIGTINEYLMYKKDVYGLFLLSFCSPMNNCLYAGGRAAGGLSSVYLVRIYFNLSDPLRFVSSVLGLAYSPFKN